MTGLTEQGRIKRSSIRKAEEEKKRKEMEKKVAEQMVKAIFPGILHIEKDKNERKNS
jgi:hypothetical protein